ncbi:uracil-DNA glycosylase family protein [Tenacibaculum dicentrarchi]|nr:uracil-DNA glycosylase family protein [Tenacibaculum dicentrarchi]
MRKERSTYNDLVEKRKECFKCKEYGFLNQSETEFDTIEIGNWSTWANNLNADILIIGQDYADQKTFNRDLGKIETKELDENSLSKDYSTVTNFNLRELSKIIDYDIGLPNKNSEKKIFLTNSVLCLKSGAMNASIPNKVYKNCSSSFLIPLIKILSPKIIITLGSTATKATITAFKDRIINSKKLINGNFSNTFKESPIKINNSKVLIFPVYHPGSLGQSNRQRIDNEKRNGFELQKADWLTIKEFLTKI